MFQDADKLVRSSASVAVKADNTMTEQVVLYDKFPLIGSTDKVKQTGRVWIAIVVSLFYQSNNFRHRCVQVRILETVD